MSGYTKFYKVKIDHLGHIKTFMVRNKEDVDEVIDMAPRYGYKVVGWNLDHTVSANDVFNELVMAELGC